MKRHNFFRSILDILYLGEETFEGGTEGWASGLEIGVRYHLSHCGLPRTLLTATMWVMVMMMMVVIMSNEMELMRTIAMK